MKLVRTVGGFSGGARHHAAGDRAHKQESVRDAVGGGKEHEMHHRGQLMLVERMLGIVPHLTRRLRTLISEMKKADAAPRS